VPPPTTCRKLSEPAFGTLIGPGFLDHVAEAEYERARGMARSESWSEAAAAWKRDAGCEVLVGRSIDLVGTELPYQPFVAAGRDRTPPRPAAGRAT
jgi:hypothetical protein